MSDNMLMIGVAAIKGHLLPVDAPLDDRLRAAFRSAWKDFGLTTNDDVLMRVGIGAVMIQAEDAGRDDEVDRLKRSMDALRSLAAMLSGVPVDLEAMSKQASDDLVPLMPLYKEAKAEIDNVPRRD